MAAKQTIPFKWIKGAKLEFELSNPIYLAMRADDGSLMTLKQAELPRNDWDDERKATGMSALDLLRKEHELLSSLKHGGIIECYGAEQTADAFNVFLEYVPGGSVESLIAKYGALEEALAKAFSRSIVEGVAYLHSQAIVHNAISTNHIFVDNKGNCKIAEFSKTERLGMLAPRYGNDFGASCDAGYPGPGTLEKSPEEAQQVNGKNDIWSVGCVVSRMLTGQPTEQGEDKLAEGSSAPPMPSNVELSEQANDFLSQCFRFNPNERPTAEDLLNHPWLTPASS